MTTIDIADLPALLDEADIPSGIRAKIDPNPYVLQRVLEALGEIDFARIETTRAFAFLLIADRSASVWNFRDSLVDCYRGTIDELKGIQTTGTLMAGCIAITDQVEGGEVLLPFQPIGATMIDSNFVFEPSGSTPLYDTVVVSLVALRILIVLAKRARIQLTAMSYIVTDGEDVGSFMFTERDVTEMVTLLTSGRRKHRVSGVGVGGAFAPLFAEMGVAPDAIREIGVDPDAIKALFAEMSQSVTSTSQGHNDGGF